MFSKLQNIMVSLHILLISDEATAELSKRSSFQKIIYSRMHKLSCRDKYSC